MFLILQETRFQDQVLKSSSLFKKQAERRKFIKVRQLHLSSLRKLFQPCVLNTCSTASQQLLDSFYLSRFKEIEILFCFLGIRECVFGPSFFLTLDI